MLSQAFARQRRAERVPPLANRKPIDMPKSATEPVRVTKQTWEDRRKVLALRREVACSLARMLYEDGVGGTVHQYIMNSDGYRVARINMGDADLLLAVRGSQRDMEVRYVFLDGRDDEPMLCKIRLREPDISDAALGCAGQ